MPTRRGAKRKALGELFKYHEAMYIIMVLWTQFQGLEAITGQLTSGGASIPGVGTIDSANLGSARAFLVEENLIEVRNEGRTIYHKLTPQGTQLGRILSELSRFVTNTLQWT